MYAFNQIFIYIKHSLKSKIGIVFSYDCRSSTKSWDLIKTKFCLKIIEAELIADI